MTERERINPSVIALHGSLVEIACRVSDIEARLNMPTRSLKTFKSDVPPPDEWPGGITARLMPCSCEESMALRERVRQLEAKLMLLEPIGGAP